jgi:inositol oxygenase
MAIEEAFEELEEYVDASDPDLDLPNLLHLLQTAEGLRRAGHPDWLQLTGLLHDVGKIMFLWGASEDGQDGRSPNGKQWALGGDTFVVGCKIPECAVFPEFNRLNPDMNDERYNTECGIYERHCGLDELKFAWGHDEYMYRMLVANGCTLPREGLDAIRYHSAYPWHDKGAYRHLMKPEDYEREKWVQLFNRYDLYTKDAGNELRGETMREELWPYYRGLLEKYGLGGKLKW